MSVQTLEAEPRTVTVVSWKTPIILSVVVVLVALLPLLAPRKGDATFRFAGGNEILAIPDLSLPGTATAWVGVVIAAVIALLAVMRALQHRTLPLWLVAVYAAALIFGFLAWAAAGSEGTLPMISLLSGALALATPLIFGALGGVIGERAGVVNIAIEAQLLAGAFCAAIVASVTGTPWAGLIAAMVAGVLVALVLGIFSITYYVDQVIVGVVLNVLVIGITSFLFRQVLAPDQATLNTVEPFKRLAIPLLSQIPVLGPILFRQTIIVYLMYIIVFVVWYGMYRTRWGLRMRAVGEHPQAADTVGINVARTRYMNVLIAGAIAGMGGAFYTLVSVPRFNPEMTAGAGFIALAAVIFGKWDPIKATLAALLFGFATNLQSVLSVIGSPVPSQFMLMLPYIVTIFAVAGLVGRSRPPAEDGVPYIKS
ncbi:ABC transporter permease [uncultured Microbacterium sp.]|uniref:ABC transporter permease n=1 Tax=uncultured Microbacterium sp. TaxID=191216 RepID=UPI002604C11B|nr:ABC transporter permease [uncultured Microbacterium sp.]